jgi:hypothetical protein
MVIIMDTRGHRGPPKRRRRSVLFRNVQTPKPAPGRPRPMLEAVLVL